MSYFQKILVPVDFTEKNQHALDVAFEISAGNGAHISLLHVIEKIEYLHDEEIDNFYSKLYEHARSEFEKISRRFIEAGRNVECDIRYGKRGREIVQCAIEQQVDLIVMNSHKVDVSRPTESWSTLSYQVSAVCPCAVLLVKRD